MIDRIEELKSPKGGWSRASLAKLGVPWPPPQGWRRQLETQGYLDDNMKKPKPKKAVVHVGEAKPFVGVGTQLTIWFFNDGEGNVLFFPTLDKARVAALEVFDKYYWTQLEIECCATPRLSNDAICTMLNGIVRSDCRWMVGRRVFETITKDGEILSS